MIWQVPRIWDGGDVWILGGGPSVTEQFNIPKNIVNSVFEGSSSPNTYSSYMSFLHDKHVIGINAAYLIGNWIDIVFFGDVGFFLKHRDALAQFPGIKVSCHPTANKYDWIKYLPRDTKHPRGISSNPKMVSWNSNSGAAAISVAANIGAKRIILLGFDMKLSDSKHQHWHNVYNRNYTNPNPKKAHHLPFDRHLRGFSEIAKDAKHRGIEILNCSPDSMIKEFPKYNLKELILDNS
jgi:hypothetical protein